MWYTDIMSSRTFIASIAFAIAGAVLTAQTADKPFTDKEVQKAIADWPAAVQWLEARGKRIGTGEKGGLAAAVFLEKDFEAFLKGRGWTVERFSYVTGKAFSLMLIVAAERENPEIAAQFDEAIAQIRASDMPAADQAESIKAIEDARAAMFAISADDGIDQGALAIVRKRFDELKLLAESVAGED